MADAARIARAHPFAGWLRARVITLRSATRRRTFPAAVELVAPGTPADDDALAVWNYGDESTDHALRVDVLVRLLADCSSRGVSAVALVHVRPGPHEPTDLDHGWAAATRTAAAISAVEVVNVLALSRWGWHDLVSGAERTWTRLRDRTR